MRRFNPRQGVLSTVTGSVVLPGLNRELPPLGVPSRHSLLRLLYWKADLQTPCVWSLGGTVKLRPLAQPRCQNLAASRGTTTNSRAKEVLTDGAAESAVPCTSRFLSPHPAWVVQAHADDAQVDPGVPLVPGKARPPRQTRLRSEQRRNNAFANSACQTPMTGTANHRPCSL